MNALNLPPDVARKLQMAQQQQAMIQNMHMNITSQVMAKLMDQHCNEDDIRKRAKIAMKAADALMMEYGIQVERRNPNAEASGQSDPDGEQISGQDQGNPGTGNKDGGSGDGGIIVA